MQKEEGSCNHEHPSAFAVLRCDERVRHAGATPAATRERTPPAQRPYLNPILPSCVLFKHGGRIGYFVNLADFAEFADFAELAEFVCEKRRVARNLNT